MYARRVDDQTLNFAVSGMLWRDSLVMIDKETKSLWSQLLGEAMHGKLKGTELKIMPSIMTSWKNWREKHPATTIVKMLRSSGPGFPYDFNVRRIRRHPDMLIGLAGGEQARAWTFGALKGPVVVNDTIPFDKGPRGRNVVVVYDERNGTAVIRDRRVDGRVLSFEWKSGVLIDRQTKSKWDALTGTSTSGPMKGKTLQLLPGIVSYGQAWDAFHPTSTYWQPAGTKP